MCIKAQNVYRDFLYQCIAEPVPCTGPTGLAHPDVSLHRLKEWAKNKMQIIIIFEKNPYRMYSLHVEFGAKKLPVTDVMQNKVECVCIWYECVSFVFYKHCKRKTIILLVICHFIV